MTDTIKIIDIDAVVAKPDELSRPLGGGKARSVESRQRVKRAPFGYNR